MPKDESSRGSSIRGIKAENWFSRQTNCLPNIVRRFTGTSSWADTLPVEASKRMLPSKFFWPNGETLLTNHVCVDIVDILVVEDDESQRASIVQVLQDSIPDVSIIAVHNGADALDFLFCRGAWTDRLGQDPPRLVLLDLALPETDGFSVLGQIRSLDRDNSLTIMPVVIFTDSRAPADVLECYRCGANSYIIKPVSLLNFNAVVETVGQYWINHNRGAHT